ncbi:MAG: hypothetical protein QOJ09_2639, partial [Actinomycetota bacterium]|nr:hypothetical protein [Actinomycetota bacterium]
MKLALYHPWTYLRGGIERVIAELLARSQHEWTLYTHHFAPDDTFAEFGAYDVVELSPRVSVRRSLGPIARAAATITATKLPAGARGLLISSDGLGDLMTFRNRIPTACYCHTPLKILHDPTTNAELTRQDRAKAAALSVLGPGFEALDRRAWRRFQHAFANSAETKRRLEGARLVPTGELEVLHPGVDLDRFRRPGVPRSSMFLVAGRIMWQKRVELAIDAWVLATAAG